MIYIEIGLVIILGLLFDNISERGMRIETRKKAYIAICLTLFWIMAAFRNVEWVRSLHLDAGGYSYVFQSDRMTSWSFLFTGFRTRYILRQTDSDIGYDILNKVIGVFTDDYNTFSLFADALFFVPFGILLYKYTERISHLIFAFIFYIALIQTHMFSGARQMFAIGLDMIAFMCAMKDRKKLAILFLALGMTIHFSSLLFALPLILIFIDIKPIYLKRMHLASFIAFPVVFMFPNQIITLLGNAVGMEKYANYGANAIQGGANTFIFLIELLSLFCYFTIRLFHLEENADVKKIYTMIPFMTLTGPLIHSNGSMIRICMYYYLYLVLLLPYGIDRIFTKNSHQIAYAMIIGVLSFLVLRGGVADYHFMWQTF